MKKIIAVLIIMVIFTFVFIGCKSSLKENDTNKKTVGIMRDLTIQLNKTYLGPVENNKIIKVDSIADSKYSQDLKAIFDDSEEIIRGTVKNINYTSFDGIAWTKVDILVSESYKGNLKTGDLVSVFMIGGYIRLKDHIDYHNDKFRFSKLSENEINNTVIKEINNGMPFQTVGGDFIYCLVTTPVFSPLPKGSYERLSPAGELYIDSNGNFIQDYYDEGKKTSYNFSIEEVKGKIIK